MKTIRLLIMRALWLRRGVQAAGNAVADGIHEQGFLTKLADAAFASRYLLVQFGTDADHVALADATHAALGPCYEAPSANDVAIGVPIRVDLFGKKGTKLVVASAAVVAGATLIQAAAGKVVTLPTSGGGTGLVIGRALTAASGDGEVLEVQDCVPYAVTIAT